MRFYSRCEILFRFEGIPNTLASRIDLIPIVHHQSRSRESPLGVANPYFNFDFLHVRFYSVLLYIFPKLWVHVRKNIFYDKETSNHELDHAFGITKKD